MSIQCGWLRRSYWTAIVIHIIGSDEHIAMLSSTVIINSQIGYKVDIDDSSVYMIGKNHANVIITPYYARWNPSYPVEVLWGKGFAVYRLDCNGNRKGTESSDFGLAIANYMSEHY